MWAFTVLAINCSLCLSFSYSYLYTEQCLHTVGQSLELSTVQLLVLNNCAKLILHIALPSFCELPLPQNNAHGHICIV